MNRRLYSRPQSSMRYHSASLSLQRNYLQLGSRPPVQWLLVHYSEVTVGYINSKQDVSDFKTAVSWFLIL